MIAPPTPPQATALVPMIDALRDEVAGLSAEAEGENERARSARSELATAREQLTQVCGGGGVGGGGGD